MKNAIKLLSLMLVAGTMFVSCGGEVDPVDPITPTTYTVKVNANDATLGNVTISPMKDAYEKGETVTITATPNDNANFLNWNGTITENPYNYVVEGDMTFTANFEAKPVPSIVANFDGEAINFGCHEALSFDAGGTYLWICQAGRESSPNGGMYLPVVVSYIAGNTPSEMFMPSQYPLEFYYENILEAGEEQYPDWPILNLQSLNCTALDLTNYVLSYTLSATLYSLQELADGIHDTPEECTQKNFALTVSNFEFPLDSSKGFTKARIIKK